MAWLYQYVNNSRKPHFLIIYKVLIAGSLSPSEPYSLFAGCTHLAAGLACGGSGLAAGLAIGKAGDAFVRAYVYQSRV